MRCSTSWISTSREVGPDAPVGWSESEHRARRGGVPAETSNKVYVNKKAICDYDQCPGIVGTCVAIGRFRLGTPIL